MPASIPVNGEVFVMNAAGYPRLKIRTDSDGGFVGIRCNATGVEQETVFSYSGTTGALSFEKPYRSVAANDPLAITADDADGVIHLVGSTDANAKAATFSGTFREGQTIDILLLARSSTGTYTIAASSLTITLDASREGCRIVYDGSAWQIAGMTGGSTAA